MQLRDSKSLPPLRLVLHVPDVVPTTASDTHPALVFPRQGSTMLHTSAPLKETYHIRELASSSSSYTKRQQLPDGRGRLIAGTAGHGSPSFLLLNHTIITTVADLLSAPWSVIGPSLRYFALLCHFCRGAPSLLQIAPCRRTLLQGNIPHVVKRLLRHAPEPLGGNCGKSRCISRGILRKLKRWWWWWWWVVRKQNWLLMGYFSKSLSSSQYVLRSTSCNPIDRSTTTPLSYECNPDRSSWNGQQG
ncbi:uncharacterized protein B0I36DRAFT_15147 [Microdochium trichocladiopsis]|uniref:Uncharacterized protein n=1 Tax=Microdochium trichocladiopsis TaxID=1682393 RepID=A0A9P9BVX5_9PEZI|nr:uncharacterized protein B0I36DRAFT_15147 [Microdochium trichocladiopsis]KAH7040768.1 hypothetical protein B0I36DRAFT_15147 [Microdochium trichocladiopsis]